MLPQGISTGFVSTPGLSLCGLHSYARRATCTDSRMRQRGTVLSSLSLRASARGDERGEGQERSGGAMGRRGLLAALVLATVAACGGGGGAAHAEEKTKVWGAAELDFRMYLCGATGKGCPAKTETVVAAARTLNR